MQNQNVNFGNDRNVIYWMKWKTRIAAGNEIFKEVKKSFDCITNNKLLEELIVYFAFIVI
jgi:hypothetical protein